MASAPSGSRKSRCIMHLESYRSRKSPIDSFDQAIFSSAACSAAVSSLALPFSTRATSSDHLHWSRETAYAHTTGFLELSTHVLPFTPALGAEETGLDGNQIISFARRQARTGVRRFPPQTRPAR